MLSILAEPLAAACGAVDGVDPAAVAPLIQLPGKASAGDLALPCFRLAKAAGMNPPQLAAALAEQLDQLDGVSASAAGPFCNLRLAPAWVAQALLPELQADPTRPLRSPSGSGKTVCLDFSSPNIAKHFAFHHVRSTGIGRALAGCYEAAGWKVVRINFLGDWGTAFGRLIAGWKREGLSLADLEGAEDPVGFFNQLYIRISQAGKDDDSVADEAREWSRRCEAGDEEALELWRIIRDVSLDAAKRVYTRLGIEFDDWNGEAHYKDAGAEVVAELEAKNLLTEDQGAKVVDLSDQGLKKPCLILRSDGGTLYATRDLAACADRKAKYTFDRSCYVVDLGQSLHFKEWFAVAKAMDWQAADQLRHIGFGVVQMWNDAEDRWAKTATRNGAPWMLMDILDEAVARSRQVIEEKNPDLPDDEKAAIAEAVGCGAVLFNNIKHGRKNDVKFRFEDALNMQGETGPYLQFAHARLCSIERKFADTHPEAPAADAAKLGTDPEKAVLIRISLLQGALERVVDEDEPSHLVSALMDLAAAVSSWLTAGNSDPDLRVLCPDAAVAASRLALVAAARACLGDGLNRLGLRAPERM